ncbi:hypothetical protein MY4824_009570 [Beauveria thailandica]
MHSDFETAAREASGMPPYAVVFSTFFGTMPLQGMVQDTDTMDKVKARIAAVTQFLNGGGLRSAGRPGKPLLICSDSELEHEDPDSAVRDDKGEYIVSERDPNTNEPVAYLDFHSVFPDANWPIQQVFWCNIFKGYMFAANQKLCSDTLQGAVTQKIPKVAQGLHGVEPFTIGEPSRLLLLCPQAFDKERISPDGRVTVHSFPSLADAVDPDNYPEGDLKQEKYRLDWMLPKSATLYHELYHLTDEYDTKDPSYSLKDILKAAREGGPVRTHYTQNPESYVYAAMANYLYLNGPFINQRVIYREWEGRSFSSDFLLDASSSSSSSLSASSSAKVLLVLPVSLFCRLDRGLGPVLPRLPPSHIHDGHERHELTGWAVLDPL